MQHNEDADIDDDKYIALNDWVIAMQNIVPLKKPNNPRAKIYC